MDIWIQGLLRISEEVFLFGLFRMILSESFHVKSHSESCLPRMKNLMHRAVFRFSRRSRSDPFGRYIRIHPPEKLLVQNDVGLLLRPPF